MRVKLIYITLLVVNQTSGASENLTDVTLCKLSHLGLEYGGHIAKSESWVRCQSWTSNEPHVVADTILDDMFPERSKKRAKNYCRNPTNDPDGPWCYTMNLDLKYETCGIPLCKLTECKLTGPGIEYSGKQNRGISDRKCLKWNKERSQVKERESYTSYPKFNKKRFPDESLSGKFCRNPNGDVGGPWCFVENEDTDDIEREYCDVPFCIVADCMVFTRNTNLYGHYTDFNDTLTRFSFGVKLWDSDSYMNATAKLVISLVALPVSGQQVQDLGIGIEISISNKGTSLTYGNKDTPEYVETYGILKSTEYTMFTLSWTAPFVTLGLEGQIRPLFLAEYRTKQNLLGYKKSVFNFYSAQGTNILWTFPFCMDDFECDVQTTTSAQFQQFWPVKSSDVSEEVHFYLRAFHSVHLLFVASPTVDYPNIKFTLQDSTEETRVTVQFKEGSSMIIKELPLPNIMDYWKWQEFSVSFFADLMQFYWVRSSQTVMIFEIKHDLFRIIRWFSPSSDTRAHWTFFCLPPEVSKPPPALLPECALNKNEENYKGTQDVTSLGMPCLPWSGTKLLPSAVENYLSKNSSLEAWNYCRDPSKEHKGTYCYTFSSGGSVVKSVCNLRPCKSEQCRVAGTGNDYVGRLAVTRSNRTCDFWFYNVTFHRIEIPYFNVTLFPDLDLRDVKNSCRNPSRDETGTWCYSREIGSYKDACNVRDCEKPEENIIITSGAQRGRKVYILPQWKISGLEFSVKQWDPDISDGLEFKITSSTGGHKVTLLIGAMGNEKVMLFHDKELRKEKTFVHLISSGKWTDFWLVMRKGAIHLGFKGVPDSFFEYENEEVFDPTFVAFGSLEGNTLGLFFKTDECHTEVVSINSFTKIMPVGMWSPVEKPIYKNFTLLLRGEGLIQILLMTLPKTVSSYYLTIDTKKNEMYISLNAVILKMETPEASLVTSNKWTRFKIRFTEHNFWVAKENDTMFIYHSSQPLLIYWFSLGMEKGAITWSANCDPLDIDGPPRDGGWSPWSPWHCTVKCGGGQGFRTRTCSNPAPNVLGKLCPGSHKSTGVCNDFLCGDISPINLEKMRENLLTHQFSHIIDEGRSVVLHNDKDMLKIISAESPDAYYEWTLNGLFMKSDGSHLNIKGDDVVIKDAQLVDAGVYACTVYRINKKRVILRVVSLAVMTNDYSIVTRATRPLTLTCQAVVLGYIYTDLSLKLYLNEKVYKDFGTTVLAASNSEMFDQLNTSHTGDWKCVVEQKDLHLSWVTNYLRVDVQKAPNFYTNLMEDDLTRPFFGWLETESNVVYALFFIVVFVIILVILFLFVYFKYCTIQSRWQ